MVYPFPIFLNFQTNISKCLILRISQSQIFVPGISLGHLHSIPPRAPASLGALLLLRTLVALAFFKSLQHPSLWLHHCDEPPLLCRSHQQAPQTRFARPNCHSIASLPPCPYPSLTPLLSFFLPSRLQLPLFNPPHPLGIFIRPINIPGSAWPCLRQVSQRSAAGGGATVATLASCAHSGRAGIRQCTGGRALEPPPPAEVPGETSMGDIEAALCGPCGKLLASDRSSG